MTSVGEHIQSIDDAICQNIASLGEWRNLLSKNILAQLRNLVESVAVRLEAGTSEVEYNYPQIGSGLAFVKSKGQYSFLAKFHKLLEASVSHYTMDGDSSERLMLKYYEYLQRIRKLLKDACGIEILANLESFPVSLDPSLQEYQKKIVERIQQLRSVPRDGGRKERYYIHATRPFFVGGQIYYEVTFYRAINKVSKFDRIIAFTDIDVADKYSAMLTLQHDVIQVFNQEMPITLISAWEVSIRPCEFDNFARLMKIALKVSTSWPEYRYLMRFLTEESGSLLELMDMPDDQYAAIRNSCPTTTSKLRIFPVLDKARDIIRSSAPGSNMLRYLMLQMRNEVLKSQYDRRKCDLLSNLNLAYGCIPFDTMPFCSSPLGHNVRYWDLVESIDSSDREHELLARLVQTNIETRGMLYTPVADLEEFENIEQLISTYNRKLYYKHTERQLIQDKGHVFIRGYEDDTVAILKMFQKNASSGIEGYMTYVERWSRKAHNHIDDEGKRDALKRLFSQSKIALIYGAAGTGKSTMISHIAQYFNDKEKLFLAHTNPAKGNLERKVTAQNSTFRTIASHIRRTKPDPEYDLLVIDECSIVSNSDLIEVLEKTAFKLLVLVGDVYQIESIRFGNWFNIIRSFVPTTAVFELTTPYRTKSESLLAFWSKVRNIEDDIAEFIARNGYSAVLDGSLFEAQGNDEIVLCLNYDGLYGINNINRFLQGDNPNQPISWHAATYKIGDPVLFNDSERFRPIIYNNLKGKIVDIVARREQIQFDIELDRKLDKSDIIPDGLEWLGGSTVRFTVYDHDVSDSDDDSPDAVVPFQVAYAVSIHKAQGLEYDSVKIVITDANEENVTHNILYTAVTRARETLKIFWTPETQQAILKKFHPSSNSKDIALLSKRRNLTPIFPKTEGKKR